MSAINWRGETSLDYVGPSWHPPENAPFDFGMSGHSGTRRKMLLRFRHVGPFRHPPENAPAFPACRPSMAAKKSAAVSGAFNLGDPT
ncbi:MAG TPA: hypothetical protein VLB69_11160 [Rudaea sp.]|nr:hypothetical protein [Rudaea sp.]